MKSTLSSGLIYDFLLTFSNVFDKGRCEIERFEIQRTRPKVAAPLSSSNKNSPASLE